ncbi:Lipoate-protein ligase LplJ [compost metagenome]
MFNLNLNDVAASLHANPEKFKSKSTKSVRSRVANIADFLEQKMTIEQFRAELLRHIFGVEAGAVSQYRLTEDDWSKIHEISNERYKNWDWNFGLSPESNVKHTKKFPVGIIDLRMNIKDGHIQDIKIYGDFFGVGDVTDIEDKLRGVRHEEGAVRKALADIDVKHYFGNLEFDDFVGLVFLKE